jgi:hypothetical protein
VNGTKKHRRKKRQCSGVQDALTGVSAAQSYEKECALIHGLDGAPAGHKALPSFSQNYKDVSE